MTWPLTLGAAVFVGYRPSGLAWFAITVTIISLATAARATGFLSGKQIGRLASLVEASIELRQKVLERDISEQDREEARLKLLSRVLDMPVADCATEPTTNGSVRSALDLLLSFEDRQANVGLQ